MITVGNVCIRLTGGAIAAPRLMAANSVCCWNRAARMKSYLMRMFISCCENICRDRTWHR